MTAAGVDAAVLVQAFGAYTYDNSYTIDAAAASPDRFVSIAIVDAEDPATPATVSALAHETGFTGVRLFSIGALEHPQPTWLDHPITFELWEVCADARPPRGRRVLARAPLAPPARPRAVPRPAGRARPLRFRRPRRRSPVPAGGGAVRARRAHQPAPEDHVPRARSGGDAGDAERHRRPSSSPSSARAGWSGAPITRRPTTARTPTSSRSPSTRAATSRSHDRALVLGGTALELWPELAR